MSKKQEAEGEPKAPKALKKEKPKLLSLVGLGLQNILVNKTKAERAVDAANGRPKPQSAEAALAGRFKVEGLEGAKLVQAVYEGLGGLVNPARAKKNRENEAKAEKAKRSR